MENLEIKNIAYQLILEFFLFPFIGIDDIGYLITYANFMSFHIQLNLL